MKLNDLTILEENLELTIKARNRIIEAREKNKPLNIDREVLECKSRDQVLKHVLAGVHIRQITAREIEIQDQNKKLLK